MTKLTNSEEWDRQLAQGLIAEEYINMLLTGVGYHLIKQSRTSEPDLTYEEGFSVEVKAKPELEKYPGNTGFNLSYYEEYKKRNTFVVFIETEKGIIYGQWLDILSQPKNIFSPNFNSYDGPKIIFKVSAMRYDWLQAIHQRHHGEFENWSDSF